MQDSATGTLTAAKLRAIALAAGADDVGFVEVSRPALNAERDDIVRLYPRAKTVLVILRAVNRESVQSPGMNLASEEFGRAHDSVTETEKLILRQLNAMGVRGVSTTFAFPADFNRWPGKVWDISHKTIAEQAGLGLMGKNRLVLHPRLGAFIMLNSMLIDAELDEYSQPLKESPCINCGLCASVCPVGALGKDGAFTFLSCMTHNYRYTMAGFQDWVESMVASGSVNKYRSRFDDSETLAMWQSLTYGYPYVCSYCMAVCPAGSDNLGLYEADKKAYMAEIFKPLKHKDEPVYVIEGTRAEDVVRKNASKHVRLVRTPIRPRTIASFQSGLGLLFNPKAAKGIDLTLHFEFWGKEEATLTVVIKEQQIDVTPGHNGKSNLLVRADSETWLKMLGEEVSPLRAMISGKLKVKGNPLNMKKFKSCITI